MGLLGVMFQSAPLPMLLCGFPDGEVLMSNRRADELFVMARPLHVDAIIGQQVWSDFTERLRGGGFIDDYEVLLETAYGQSFYSVLSGQLIKFGGATCILIGASDITDRKRAEEMMMKFFDSAPMVMILARIADGQILQVNRRASELFDPGDGSDRRYLDHSMGIVARTIFIDRLGGGGFIDNFEAELTTDYGEKFWANLSGQVMDVEGERCVLIGVSDISDRKLSEDELRAAKDEAERATKSKSLFLATMSHEIRTPMNGVLGMLDLLSATTLTVEQDEMVRVIGDSASTLLTIIDDILDVSKIEAGKLHIERVSTRLSELLESTLDLVSSRARAKGIEMAWLLDAEIPEFVFGDPVRLRQILLNLLGNAVKFTLRGYVALKATLTGSDGRFISVRFDVEDSGIGLTEEQRNKLFQPFAQADDSTTRRFGGTGLGLSICRRLVSMMGGDIGVTSQEGKGSVFWFEVPLETAETVPTNTMRLDGVSVLVVEDMDVTKRSIHAILSRHGATVLEARSAREMVVALSDSQSLDIALVDEDLLTPAVNSKLMNRLPAERILRLTNGVVPNGDHTKISKPVHSQHLLRVINYVTGRTKDIYEKVSSVSKAAITPLSVDDALAAGQLILVAEDNRTNQLVISKQLTRLGYAFETVADGEEAWKALQVKDYGLLLTDCHMPELDGYLLTGRIREAEILSGKRLPIIALTASALRDDAEKCLRCGMDDYLSKPIVIERLSQTLKRWMPKSKLGGGEDEDVAEKLDAVSVEPEDALSEIKAEIAAMPTVDAVPLDVAEPVDLERLTAILGDNDPAVHLEMLEFFVECFDELFDNIVTTFASGNRIDLRNAAHAAKGAAQNAGTTVLGATLLKLEKTAPNGEQAELEDLVQSVEIQFAEVGEFVRKFADKVGGRIQ